MTSTVHLRNAMSQRWRNGGGVTHELLVWPKRHDWKVRVSVATIEHSGPFSRYPGVERWFTVLTGAGVRLELADRHKMLVPGDEPVHFDGEAAPICHLLDGPTSDLNLMVRRGAAVATMRRATPGSSIDAPLKWRGLFAGGPVLLEIHGKAERIEAGALIWADETEASAWQLHPDTHGAGTGPAWWLTLEG